MVPKPMESQSRLGHSGRNYALAIKSQWRAYASDLLSRRIEAGLMLETGTRTHAARGRIIDRRVA